MAERMVRWAARRAGIGRQVTPHTLRHTCATQMVRMGAPIESVSRLLGHSDLSCTQIYTHVAGVDVKQTHEAAHPRERGAENREALGKLQPVPLVPVLTFSTVSLPALSLSKGSNPSTVSPVEVAAHA